MSLFIHVLNHREGASDAGYYINHPSCNRKMRALRRTNVSSWVTMTNPVQASVEREGEIEHGFGGAAVEVAGRFIGKHAGGVPQTCQSNVDIPVTSKFSPVMGKADGAAPAGNAMAARRGTKEYLDEGELCLEDSPGYANEKARARNFAIALDVGAR